MAAEGGVDIQVMVPIPEESATATRVDGEGPPTSTIEPARSIVSCASSNIRRSTMSSQQRRRRAQWRGIGSRFVWDACRVILTGVGLIVVGSIIATVGYNSEIATLGADGTNYTLLLLDPRSQKRQKISHSYFGPVLIGMGAFILMSVCVLTMEMRDMAAKVFPLTKRIYTARPQKSHSTGSKKTSKLFGAASLAEFFQTPAQRIVKELYAARLERSRSATTQTLARWRRPHWRRFSSTGSRQRICKRSTIAGCTNSAALPKMSRSCHLLCAPLDGVTKRRPQHANYHRQLFRMGRMSTWASCPLLVDGTIS